MPEFIFNSRKELSVKKVVELREVRRDLSVMFFLGLICGASWVWYITSAVLKVGCP